jgi:hypothetical protein
MEAREGITLPDRPRTGNRSKRRQGTRRRRREAKWERGRREDCTRGAAAASSQCGRKKSGGFGEGEERGNRREDTEICSYLFFFFLSPIHSHTRWASPPISFPAQAAQATLLLLRFLPSLHPLLSTVEK